MTVAELEQNIERLNVSQFHRMIELGILPEGESIELIDGLLVRKNNRDSSINNMTHGPRHAYYLQRLKYLETLLQSYPCHLRQQLPITLSDYREPEPDMAIVRGVMDDYIDHHPGAEDCLLVIEVADSSLDYDRTQKAQIYAAAGIPVYWLVNIVAQQIEINQTPLTTEQRYVNQIIAQAEDSVELLHINDVTIQVALNNIL